MFLSFEQNTFHCFVSSRLEPNNSDPLLLQAAYSVNQISSTKRQFIIWRLDEQHPYLIFSSNQFNVSEIRTENRVLLVIQKRNMIWKFILAFTSLDLAKQFHSSIAQHRNQFITNEIPEEV